ncbi:hypothetical protein [Streptomyces sp. YIM B13518]|uniref:hypothetical protein n=1 Tax=Streptomyces sp. YIM B13518 TaxID=3366316 RepID=UPI0036743C64
MPPATVVHCLPAKEDTVLPDEYDRPMVEALAARPSEESRPASVRHVVRGTLRRATAERPEATPLRARPPAVRSRALGSLSATGRLPADAIAARTGLDPDCPEARAATSSLLNGLLNGLPKASAYGAGHGPLPVKSRSGGHRT